MNPDTPRGAGGRIGKQTTRRRYRYVRHARQA